MMKEKMKAAVFYGRKEDLRIESVNVPEIDDGDILLKIRACGICGSDARGYFNGIEERYKIPVILGHELTAEINKVGRKVNGYEPGERVVVAPIYGCGRCEFCISGKENLCPEVVVFGCTHDGGFAQYMKIPAPGVARGALVKIDDEISDTEGCMIEVFSCCLHGLKRMGVEPADSVAIFGAGPIGLAHLFLAKRLGATRVGMIDQADYRLEQAKSFGADLTINSSRQDWKGMVLDYFGLNGVEVVVTAAPSVAALENALEIVKSGGGVLIFGGLPYGSRLNLDPNMVHYREITLTGSIDATIDDFKRTADMAPALNLKRFITHTISLEKIKEGMEIIRQRQGLKVVLEMTS